MLLRLFRVEDKRLEGKVSWRSFLTVMSSLKVTVTTMEMTRVQEVAENLQVDKDVIYDEFIKDILSKCLFQQLMPLHYQYL